MEAVYTMANPPTIADKEDAVHNTEEIGVMDEVVGATVIWHITVGIT